MSGSGVSGAMPVWNGRQRIPDPMTRQLALDVGLADVACFENFYLTDANREVFHALQHLTAGGQYFVCGDTGSGKTHLLHAVLRMWRTSDGSGQLWSPATPAANDSGLVCVDDVQTIAGHGPAEKQLFTLYERLRARDGILVMTADRPPGFLPWHLQDLMSRMCSATVYRLAPLGDGDLTAALQLRAQSRGFALPDEVIAYVLRRYRRDSASLFGLLDLIDTRSLEAGRRVTLPFLRDLEQRSL